MMSAEPLDLRILSFIRQAPADPGAFNRLALDVFAHQFERNRAYRNFCASRGVRPDRMDSWEQIPAAPTSAFKSCLFTAFDAEKSVRMFETSGTSVGKKGRHCFDTLTLYDESALPNFRTHLLADGAELPMRILLPTPKAAPESSLVYMCSIAADAFSKDSAWYICEGILDTDALCADFEAAVESGQPRMILGTTFSFVHLLESLAGRRRTFALPARSRIMETGGTKGKSREVTRGEFLESAEKFLGIPADRIVNEYGMTELSSQLYDNTLKSTGTAIVKIPLHWMKVRIVDPVTNEVSPDGQPGLIRIWDLANRGSAIAVQTEDIGIWRDGGLRVLGRAKGVEARGCSIALDELLSR